MGKLIHSIKVVSEKHSHGTVTSTRESASRRYEACLVATTTEKSIEIAVAKKAELEAKLAKAEAKLAVEQAKWNMPVEQAVAEHNANSERWYNREDGLFATTDRLREEAQAKNGGRLIFTSFREEAEKDMRKRGFTYPYDRENTSYGLMAAAGDVRMAKSELEHHKIPTLGSQGVISWHQSVALAQKALGSREAESARKLGDRVDIRTDIEIKERATRTKKAVG